MSDEKNCGNCEWWEKYYEDSDVGACKNPDSMAYQATPWYIRVSKRPDAQDPCEHWEAREEVGE